MVIRKVDPEKEGQLLFELDNNVFTRDFDLPARNVKEEIDYLKGSSVYVVYDGEQPVGFIAYKKDDHGFGILAVVVVPEKQGKGIGKLLMQKVFEDTSGVSLHLVTHPKNTGAVAFYKTFGFTVVGQKENYYGDGEPRLLLKRNAY